MPPPGIEPATPCYPACPSNHSAIGVVDDMNKTFTVLIYATIQQKLRVVCKVNHLVFKWYQSSKQ